MPDNPRPGPPRRGGIFGVAVPLSSQGMIRKGNIDLYSRPVVENEDGSISTVRSMGVNIDGLEYLIPTVAADGSRILTEEEAVQQFLRTGQHLGAFSSPSASTYYAEQLHRDQEQLYRRPTPRRPMTGGRY